jgi:hypothetical protein
MIRGIAQAAGCPDRSAAPSIREKNRQLQVLIIVFFRVHLVKPGIREAQTEQRGLRMRNPFLCMEKIMEKAAGSRCNGFQFS